MKLIELNNELLSLAKNSGITIRKENGNFHSGYCVVKESRLIILNRTTPLEISTSVIAQCLAFENLDNTFIKPVVREFIDKEKEKGNPVEFQLEVLYDDEDNAKK